LSRKPEPPGLALRLVAAGRLQAVLRGEPFQPFGATDLPEGRNRALANRLITTALRRHGHLDIVLAELLERGMPKKSGNFEAVLRLSLAQLLYLPDLGAHSAVFLAAEALKRDTRTQHLVGLMNAVLRRAQGAAARYWDLPPTDLIPNWMGEIWTAAYGADNVRCFGEVLLDTPPLDLTVPGADPDLIEALGGEPLVGDTVRIADRDRPVDALPGFSQGRWWVQDAAAALPARLIALEPGARVLDLCAAPGGKTAQLAKAGYAVTALDNEPSRVERLRSNLGRLDLHAEIVEADAATWRPDHLFDAVLLDAPCSATGTFRRHPEVLWHRTPKDISARVALQKTLFAAALGSVKPGGTLLYAVCSLLPQEGEEIAGWALQSFPDLEVEPVPADALPGLTEAITPEGFVRTHPALLADRGGLDGFFIARFRRISDAA